MNPAPTNEISSILSRVVEAKTEHDTVYLPNNWGLTIAHSCTSFEESARCPHICRLLPRICVLLDN